MRLKKLFVNLMGIVLLCGTICGTQHKVYADTNNNQENYIGTLGGYAAGDLDNNTPIYEPEFITYADEYVPDKFPENMTEFRKKYPSLRDQGKYGACWAFSSIGLAEFDLINDKAKNSDIDLSELQLAYFTYNSVVDPLGGTKGDYTKYHPENSQYNYLDAGGNYEWAMKRLSQWVGTVNESDVPYDNALDSLSYGLDDKYAYNYDVAHLQNAYEINIKEQSEDVKKQIIEHGAVGVSYVHKAAGSNYINKSYYDAADTVYGIGDGGHAVMIVGWDDNYSKDNFTGITKPTSDGAWLVRNSWGESSSYYNVLDYFWMSYETYSLNSTAWVFDFSADGEYNNNYQLDGGLESQKDPWYNNVANVFTVSNRDGVKSETLKAVSLLFSKTADVEYTVDVYTDITDKSNPFSGKRSTGANGVTTYAGYYTIPLDEEVELKPGSTFAIVVKTDKKAIEFEYTWPTQNDENSPVIWERQVSDNYNVDKTSLYYAYGRFAVSQFGNYCIKAFTTDNYDVNDDAEIVSNAKSVIEAALKNIEGSNDLTVSEIQKVLNNALVSAGITDVDINVDKFNKTDATTEQQGSITADINIIYGSASDTASFSKIISKLPQIEPEPEPDKKNGLVKGDDGNYYYYADDVIDTSFSGFVDYENEKLYVNSGKVDVTYTDIVEDGLDKFYVENGKLNINYDDLFNSPTQGWWKISNGKVDLNYDDLFNSPTQGWWKISNGKVDLNYDDLFNSPTQGWWKISNGKVDLNYNDLFYSPTCGWWKVKGGAVDFDYNDLFYSPTCGWWKVKGGTIDYSYDDLYYSSECGWWKVKGGTIDYGYDDLYYSSECGWWKVKGGTIDYSYDDLYYSSECGWWKVKGGTIDYSYDDLYYSSECGWWKIKGGTIDYSYDDLYYSSECGWWKVKGGTIDYSYDDLYYSSECGWWKVKGGTIDYSYDDLYYSPTCGWWKVKCGTVDFNYSGIYNSSKYGNWEILNGGVIFS